jgi:hypothetical protein
MPVPGGLAPFGFNTKGFNRALFLSCIWLQVRDWGWAALENTIKMCRFYFEYMS